MISEKKNFEMKSLLRFSVFSLSKISDSVKYIFHVSCRCPDVHKNISLLILRESVRGHACFNLTNQYCYILID